MEMRANLGRWLGRAVTGLVSLAALVSACSGDVFEAASSSDGGPDGPPRSDTGTPDVIKTEAGRDSSAPDSSDPRDAPPPPPDVVDGTSDSGDVRDASDAGRDTGADASDARDGGCNPVDCPTVKFECVPQAAATGGGLVVDTTFYVAYRFQVPAGRTLTSSEVGALIRPVADAGSLFAALIAMPTPTTTLKAALTPSDVVASRVITVAGGGGDAGAFAPRVVSTLISATLAPGWYALAIGTNALGASGANLSIVSLSSNGCTNGQHLVSVRQTGENILQSSAGYMYVIAR
jgi:hypothetical protein